MNYLKTSFFVALSLYAIVLKAQQNSALNASYFTENSYIREIPPLSQMDNIISAEGFEHVAPPKRRGSNIAVAGKGLPEGEDPLATNQKSARSTNVINSPIANFVAHEGTVLNDPTGAIGPNHYVYAFNTGFGIKDRSGNVLLGEASLATLFPGETLGDPVVIYDNYAERFIIMEFSDSPNGILIAVCQGMDPVNDGWYTYRFDTGTFPDYEKISIWSDGYYITANKDQSSASTSEVVYALERDEMLVGGTAEMIGFSLPGIVTSGFYSPGGFNATGPELPPVGVGHQIVYMQDDGWSGVSSDHLKIWTTSVDWTTPSNSTIALSQELSTTAFDGVFDNGSFQNLDEPGNGPDIDVLQATMMYMTNYRRFGTHNSVVLNFVVDVSGSDDVAGIRWMELRQTSDGGAWSIYQEGTYLDPNGHSAFAGSVIMDGEGNIGMGYTIVSSSQYTSLRYTGRYSTDALGTMTLGEGVAVDGDSQNNRSDGRYGDYSQITIDPLDDMTFWHIGEYLQGNSSVVRKSGVVAFQIGTAVIDDEAPTTPTSLTVSNVTATTATLAWTASTDNISVSGYDIYSAGSVIASAGSTISTTVTGLSPNTSYSFSVLARDPSGNESALSSSVLLTTTDIVSCEGGISSFPYTEGFESGLGDWTQSSSDDLDWTVDASGTPSGTTGPSAASEGSNYIYVEASVEGTGFPDKQAILESPCFDITGLTAPVFSFNYHMYGSSDFGTLDLEISNDNGLSWTSIWQESGNNGDAWLSESVDLSAYTATSISLRFNRVTGSTWQADAAIDNIELSDGGGVSDSNCASGDLTLSITFDNYPEESSWEITNISGIVASNSYSSANADGSTVSETISGLSAGDYTFTFNDSFGDGICCSFGNGSYTLSSTSGEIVSGAEFSNSESTSFCVDNFSTARSGEGAQASISTYVLDEGNIGFFNVYPNPATDVLNIEAGDNVESVLIFTMYGQLIEKELQLESKGKGLSQLDISELVEGLYYVRINTSNDKKITKKLLVN